MDVERLGVPGACPPHRFLDSVVWTPAGARAQVPWVRRDTHGAGQSMLTWAETGSGVTVPFESLIVDWLREASVAAAGR